MERKRATRATRSKSPNKTSKIPTKSPRSKSPRKTTPNGKENVKTSSSSSSSSKVWYTPFAGGQNLKFFKIVPSYVDRKEEPGYSILPKPTYWDWIYSAITLHHVWASPNTIWSAIALGMYFYFPYDLSSSSVASKGPITLDFFYARFPLWFVVTFGYALYWHVTLYYLNWADRPFIPNRVYNVPKVLHNIFYSLSGNISIP